MFEIIIKDDKGNQLEKKSCEESSCSIGRSGKNGVCIKGWRIAGIHAELREEKDGIYIYDHSSGIGTLVNGEKVDSSGPLREADEIAISGYRLVVKDGRQEPAAASPMAAEVPIETAPSSVGGAEDNPAPVMAPQAGERAERRGSARQRRVAWHQRIHEQLMSAMDLRRTDVESMDGAQLTETIQGLIAEIISANDQDLPSDLDRERLAVEVLNEAVGLGPLEDLLADNSITEIMVNNYDDIYFERQGRLHKSD
ncbi:MAG TPA: FHA domain-containing protein, partial [Desulfopila sp.]|nr:FHA domain-containing protein [Desulfopila sp.]